jgi:RHS repeat-associated protein
MLLSALAIPLRAFLFGKIVVLLSIFLCALCAFAVSKKLGWKWGTSITSGFVVALTLTICYSYLMDVPEASASYTQSGIYYYTSDHIGRPFALRDQSQVQTWYERHLAFGDQIDEWSSSMPAGADTRQISWQPSFRFPGQYQDPDMGISATGASLFVQNHYREYMPGLGRYNRSDPLMEQFTSDRMIHMGANPWIESLNYTYGHSNTLIYMDSNGQWCWPWKIWKCNKYEKKALIAKCECAGEIEGMEIRCRNRPNCLGSLEFIAKYGGGFDSDAMLNCIHTKTGITLDDILYCMECFHEP